MLSTPVVPTAEPLVPVLPGARERIRPSRAEVDLGAIAHNLGIVRKLIPDQTRILAMVKANAYGHGLVQVARTLLDEGVFAFGVATADEALDLRESAGFSDVPIVLLGVTDPSDAPALQAANISVTVGCREVLLAHLKAAIERGEPARLHVMLDTGLGRDGFRCDELDFFEELHQINGGIEGICTHFAMSESHDEDARRFCWVQRERFENAVRAACRAGLRPMYHASNSGAVLNHPQAHYGLVRPGLLLYGAQPNFRSPLDIGLRQAITVKSTLAAVKSLNEGDSVSYGRLWTSPDSRRIGIVPMGYGDGVPLGLSNKGHVLIRGKRVPIRGRICMDHLMIDLHEVPDAELGDEVVLYGGQGDERMSLEEVAATAGTIPYDLTCALTTRIPRLHV